MLESRFFIFCCIVSIFVFHSALFSQTLDLYSDDVTSSADFKNNRNGVPMSLTADAQQAMSNPDYRVLPGDRYQLSYTAGTRVIDYPIVVDFSGIIRVSNLGVVHTKGKSFMTVKKQVEALVSKNYPFSAVQFVLVSPSTFKVIITGEVVSTTEVQATGLVRVSGLIKPHLTPFSSLRYFSITSSDGSTKSYDLFQAERDGKLSQDPYVSPGDVITIPRSGRIVHIKGAVERPGTYELLADDTLDDLITRYGGGFLPRVGVNKKQVKISRIIDGDLAIPEISTVNLEEENTAFVLKDHDTVYVEGSRIGTTQVYVELGGKAIHSFPFAPGDDAVVFVRKNSNLFTSPGIDTGRAFILRGDQRIPFNLNPILFDPSYNALLLFEAGDKLIVPSIEQTVLVTGAVLKPGPYPYMPGRTFEYYIALAGGFDYQRNTGGSITIRDVYGKWLDKNTVIGPDTVITARSNAFMYNFNIYVPLITITATILSIVTTIIALIKSNR